MDYDLIVIGGGAAGLGAARTAARRRARVLLISDGQPGGDCTFTGCVPSKTLIQAARQGLSFTAATQRVRDAIDRIAATESAAVLRGEGIEVLLGRATLTGPGQIEVDGRRLTARRFVIATGSRPTTPPIPDLDRVDYLTNETVCSVGRLAGWQVAGAVSRRLRW